MAERRKPTPNEVQAEIAALEAIQDRIRPFNAFGDDNRACIRAQIEVLKRDLSDDEITGMYADGYVQDSAGYAREWLDTGWDPDEGAGLCMSESWAPLVQTP